MSTGPAQVKVHRLLLGFNPAKYGPRTLVFFVRKLVDNVCPSASSPSMNASQFGMARAMPHAIEPMVAEPYVVPRAVLLGGTDTISRLAIRPDVEPSERSHHCSDELLIRFMLARRVQRELWGLRRSRAFLGHRGIVTDTGLRRELGPKLSYSHNPRYKQLPINTLTTS